MKYEVRLSDRAAKDLDRLNRKTQQRILSRLGQIAEAPHDPRFSSALSHKGDLRKSRVGGWRIIFSLDDENRIVYVVTIERRGQVYHRIRQIGALLAPARRGHASLTPVRSGLPAAPLAGSLSRAAPRSRAVVLVARSRSRF